MRAAQHDTTLRAGYLVGADGTRSAVREALSRRGRTGRLDGPGESGGDSGRAQPHIHSLVG
ncbi:FAD-dependent monooxygenase [Streptomyces sp. NPDC007164]|uniref:FAD-dependent monooxygenase n=1 Tax=Streptomyces sp. NPDC007164 TaxID=3156918 RepID=UPI003410CA6D